jgi:hypothetical protein
VVEQWLERWLSDGQFLEHFQEKFRRLGPIALLDPRYVAWEVMWWTDEKVESTQRFLFGRDDDTFSELVT